MLFSYSAVAKVKIRVFEDRVPHYQKSEAGCTSSSRTEEPLEAIQGIRLLLHRYREVQKVYHPREFILLE